MDKIITLIILFYVFKKIYRFLTGASERQHQGSVPHPPSRDQKPPDTSISKTSPPPHPTFPSTFRDFVQVLTDIKRQMDEQRVGKTSEQIPPQDIEVSEQLKSEKLKVESHLQKKKGPIQGMKQKICSGERMLPDEAKMIRADKIEMEAISFDQPGIFLQGIILSEILRPPLARRIPFKPPYLRG
jgi:hypothetical protein